MIRKNKSIVALITLLLVAVLASGCFLSPTKYTVDVTIEPKEAAEVKGPKKVKEGEIAEYTLEIAEGYVYVDYVVDPEDVEVLVEDGTISIAEVNENIKMTLNFEKEDEVEPEDPLEAAIEAAEEAIAALPGEITLDDEDDVRAARALVEAALEIDEDAEIEGVDRLAALEEALEELAAGQVLVKDQTVLELVLEAAQLGKKDEVYGDKTLELPGEVDGTDFILIWGSDDDLVVVEDNVATFTTPEVDTTVTLRAKLARNVDAQAETKIYEVELVIEGWVSKLVTAVTENELDDFELALIGLEIEYKDKDELNGFMGVLKAAFEDLKEEEVAALTKEDIVDFLDVHYEAGDLLEAFTDAVGDYKAQETQKALKALNAAVADLGLENWFEDLLDEYLEKDLEEAESKKAVQEFIDEVNKGKLGELITAAEGDVRDNDLYVEAKTFFDAIKANLKEEDVEGYEDRLDLIANIFAVLDADKDGIVAALKAYDDELLVLDVLAKEYVKAFEVDEVEGDPLDGKDIDEIVEGVNVEGLGDAIAAVVGEAAEEEDDKFAEALTYLTKVAVIEDKELAEEAWDISGDMDAYKDAVDGESFDDPVTAQAILGVVNEVNLVAAINAADAEELVVLILDEADIDEFTNLSPEQRVEVAERLIAAKPEKGYASSDDLFNAIENAVSSYLDNIEAVNEADETTDMIGALAAIFDDYAELTGSEKTTIADAVIDAKPEEGYTTIAAIEAVM